MPWLALHSTFAAVLLSAGLCFPAKVPVPQNGCYLSAYLELEQKTFEALVGKKLAVGMFYVNWDMANFPSGTCNTWVGNGTVPHLSWEPFSAANSCQNILSGTRDDYIRKWAQQVKAWGKPLFIRFGLEMNGDWYDWDGTHSGGSTLTGFGDPAKPDGPERFVAAYRHIHDLFATEGADNVSWVFAPNIVSVPDVSWNKIENYYPGAAYVDWLGLDGYNWGNTSGGRWETFDQVYSGPYATMCALGSQPVMIAEFASAESGGDKAAWITDCFQKVKTRYPRIKCVTWFNINKETDWRVNSSAAALAAYKTAISDPYFLSDVPLATAVSGMKRRARTPCSNVWVRENKETITAGTERPLVFNVSVCDAAGRTVYSAVAQSRPLTVSKNRLPPGLNFVTIKTPAGSGNRRVIIR